MTNYNHEQRYLPCYICGSLVFTSSSRSMCPECRSEREAENNRIRYCKRAHCQADNKNVKIVYDPLPVEDGGYKPGAVITKTDLTYGIQYYAFVVGMVFVVDGHKEVLQRVKNKLRLIPV